MAANSGLPGVDAEALSGLAGRYPSTSPKADPEEAIAPPPVAAPPKRRGGGGFAVFIALVALAVAAAPLALPHVRSWVLAEFGDVPGVARAVRMLGEASGPMLKVEALADRLAAAAGRLEANENVLSGTVGRVAVVEKEIAGLAQRVEGLAPAIPGAAAAVEKRPESIEAWAAGAAGRLETLEKEFGGAIGRVSRLETAYDLTQRRLDAVNPVPGMGRIDSLEKGIATSLDRLAKLEGLTEKSLPDALGRLAAVETTVSAATRRLDDLAAAQERVATLESRQTGLEGRVAPVETRLATVDDRVGQMQDNRVATRQSLRAAQLSLAVLQLATVAQTHRPFAKELELARSLAGNDGDILALLNVMVDFSQTGIATTAELRDSFATIVVPKIRSVSGADRPLTDRLRSWLSSAIAPSDTATAAEKDAASAIIAATTQKLAEDDTHGAIQQLAQLEGPAATLANRWLVEARARQAVDAATDALGKLMLEQLGKTAVQALP